MKCILRNNKFLNYFNNKTFFTFLCVGILNTVFGYSVFSFFIWIGLHYSLAILFATCLGVLFNFKTIGGIVFKSSHYKLIVKFVLVYTVLYFFNILCVKLFLLMHVNVYLAGAIAMGFAALLSFFLNQEFVFVEAV
ncbi:MAG: GtrA family protein [Pseudomonadota bacterium]|nr:GtrA family protein [Gammaproteobacteria bacterium]MBU1558222.1 GtrA family protein [Gammaproteobacteria bacterium]MBU1927015.1 GtrA family protein [Gammaproteobacteria bacterium]MBU2546211.1 GtrA family protein [Gammaproteobacteria bacterium]